MGKKKNEKEKKNEKAKKIAEDANKNRKDKAAIKQNLSKQERKHKSDNWSLFAEQLRNYGLKLRVIVGDGNCMFRSLADQLEGRQERHQYYRQVIVEYMSENPEDFQPFVDGDWKHYLSKMHKDGEWGGHIELAAATRCFETHIIIHNLASPRMELRNPLNDRSPRTIHLSYHNESHYSSVRNADDSLFTSARPIELLLNNVPVSAAVPPPIPVVELTRAEKIVMESTGCRNLKHIRSVLKDMDNDHDSASEFLIQEAIEGIDWDTVDDLDDPDPDDKTLPGSIVPSETVSANNISTSKIKSQENNNSSADEAERKAGGKKSKPPGKSKGGKKPKREQNLTNKERQAAAKAAKEEEENAARQRGGTRQSRERPADSREIALVQDLGTLRI
jgi:hypothetical protein